MGNNKSTERYSSSKSIRKDQNLYSSINAAISNVDLAAQYPNSKFIGVDIEPTFPNEIKPKHLEFMIADIFQRVPFPDNEFDLVHLDSVLCSTISTKIEFILNEMVRVSKPNGCIEVGETFIYKVDLVSGLYGVEKFIGLKLPDIVTKIPNIKNINVEDRAEVCEQLKLTKDQYHQLLEDIYNELECTSPEMTFRRVHAQKIS
ncbi:14830_t:CDS:2 [Funneliformis caledonium]|uniref:14830_t:CDS:1 n=1 Tax=Funneliformis caledonium TaxID=1117310 RepID=A0A9N8Z6X6_9GLOM|nr:14830_t:CDS:2 [Funneliformis caledonium]